MDRKRPLKRVDLKPFSSYHFWRRRWVPVAGIVVFAGGVLIGIALVGGNGSSPSKAVGGQGPSKTIPTRPIGSTTTTSLDSSATVVVPYVVGEPVPLASQKLGNSGLDFTTVGGVTGGGQIIVASQTPQAGMRVKRGSVVTITLQ